MAKRIARNNASDPQQARALRKIAGLFNTGAVIQDLTANDGVQLVSNVLSLADLGVTTAKIAALAVTTAKIADLGVTTAKIAAGAVTSPKLGALTTKGDLLVFDTAHNRLGVGANNTVLMADSAVASGVKWGALGSMAFQNSTSVAITGGTISGITDLAIADGGTGASTAAVARTNLGLGTIAVLDSPLGKSNLPATVMYTDQQNTITNEDALTIQLGKTINGTYSFGDWSTNSASSGTRLRFQGVVGGGTNDEVKILTTSGAGTGRFLRITSLITGSDAHSALGRITATPAAASDTVMMIYGTASQTGDLVQVRDNANNKLWLSDSAGELAFAGSRLLRWSSSSTDASASKDVGLARTGAGVLKVSDGSTGTGELDAGDIKIITVGKGLYVKEGANATMGAATLVAGTVTVNTTKVTASSRIMLTGQDSSGTHGQLTISARTAGTSFTITSTSGTDTRSVAWVILEPA